jgi:hypothetical protein
MTDEELRESIKNDIDITDEEIDRHCKFNNISLSEYRNRLDRAIAARKRDNPNYDPKKKPYWNK